ncbi:hypothetical protein AQUCO_01200265v1 [Aquilegia coerulea]|uniref:Uncharacterized protein n=1 Tax=Aquilegia coerulea TaxID=218851 RepID=A0A2G5E532_AQUCA|nr:hypothetical protein AQUCO_01200265v1 [Aquilegia coerulea]
MMFNQGIESNKISASIQCDTTQVRPPGSISDAIPEEATTNTILPSERSLEMIVRYRFLFDLCSVQIAILMIHCEDQQCYSSIHH